MSSSRPSNAGATSHIFLCIVILLPISYLIIPNTLLIASLSQVNSHISTSLEQLKCIALVYCSPSLAWHGFPASPVNNVHASSSPPRCGPTTGVGSWPVAVARGSSSRCAVRVLHVTLHSSWSFPTAWLSCRRALVRPPKPSQTRRLCRTATDQRPSTGPIWPSTRPNPSSVPSRPR